MPGSGSPLPPVRSKDRFLVFGAPQVLRPEIDEVVDCLESGWLGTGPKVARFEDEFKAYIGAAQASAVNSCTAALHLALVVAGVGPGDEVITTPLTFCATINAILHAGAIPVLADIDPETMNLDPDCVLRAIGPRTKAILPVHFAGRPCPMDELVELARKNRVQLIEDCAHAIETEYHGRKMGSFGGFGCFSFYVTKNVVTGEGGMLVARDEESILRAKTLALHGMSADAWKRFSDQGYRHYFVTEAGFKYNMMDIQAAIGLHQLERVEENWQRRYTIWQRYTQGLAGLPIGLPPDPEPDTRHGRHLFTILIDPKRAGLERDQFLAAMHAQNIGTGVHYLSVPEHPYYQDRLGWRPEAWPESLRIGRQTVSLPLSPHLTDDDVEDVLLAVYRVLGRE